MIMTETWKQSIDFVEILVFTRKGWRLEYKLQLCQNSLKELTSK